MLRDDGYHITEDQFLITSLTKACRIKNDNMKIRFPIQKGVLQLLLDQINTKFAKQPYLEVLYSAIFSTAYYGLFRVGEICDGTHTILAKNVHIAQNKNKMLIYLESSKMHSKANQPQIVKISPFKMVHAHRKAKNLMTMYCPFTF